MSKATKKAVPSDSAFACQECGHTFKTIAAAERAAFGPNGCPKCGGADIDLGKPQPAKNVSCCIYHTMGGIRTLRCGDETVPVFASPDVYGAALERVRAGGGRLPMGAR